MTRLDTHPSTFQRYLEDHLLPSRDARVGTAHSGRGDASAVTYATELQN